MHVRFALLYAAILLGALLAVVGAGERVEATGAAIDNPDALRINEFLADNETVWIDPDDPGLDEYPDWIELVNTGNQPVSLDGIYLTDDQANPTKFAITDGLSIPANGYVIFYADDEEEDEGPYHLGFRLSKEAGYIGMYYLAPGAQTPTYIDAVAYGTEQDDIGPQEADISTGRLPDGSGVFQRLTRPSPGRSNLVTSPRISGVERTPYLPTSSTPVDVSAIITDDEAVAEASVLYTIDGGGQTAAPMTREGQSDLYRGTIPPLPDSTVVEFTLRAVDGAGQVTPDPTFELPYFERYVVGYNVPPIAINEILPANNLGLEDPDDPGDYPDWIEIHNMSDREVSLDGLTITDDLAEPTKFAITDGLKIQPRGFAVFYADNDPEQGGYHLDFRLNRDGESVGIFGALGSVEIDSFTWEDTPDGVAHGRSPDGNGEWRVLYCTTPGAPNQLCDRQIYLPIVDSPLP